MSLCGGQRLRPPFFLTVWLGCLFLILSSEFGNCTSADIQLWFSGPAAMWSKIQPKHVQDLIKKDIDTLLFQTFMTNYKYQPNDGTAKEKVQITGLGVFITFTLFSLFREAATIEERIYGCTWDSLNTGLQEFKNSIKNLGQQNVHAKILYNDTIPINQPQFAWGQYLDSIPHTNPDEDKLPEEVLETMTLDIQLGLDSSYNYAILPTGFETEKPPVMVKYSVYNMTELQKPLTAKEIKDKLFGLELKDFGPDLKSYFEKNLVNYKDTVRLPVRLFHPLNPDPNPPKPNDIVQSDSVNVIIRFSGSTTTWDSILVDKKNEVFNSVSESIEEVMKRERFSFQAMIQTAHTIQEDTKNIQGLLIHAEIRENMMRHGMHMWNAQEISSLIYQADFQELMKIYNSTKEGENTQLIAVSLNTQFGPVLTSNGSALIAICIVFILGTIVLVAIYMLIIYIRGRAHNAKDFVAFRKTQNMVCEDVENIYSCPNSMGSSVHLGAMDGRRLSEVVINPLGPTQSTRSFKNPIPEEHVFGGLHLNESMAGPLQQIPRASPPFTLP